MTPFIQWIQQHPATAAFAGLWIYSAIVSTMPAPTAESSVGYVWLYRLLHLVASNLDKMLIRWNGIKTSLPNLPGIPSTTEEKTAKQKGT